MCEVERGGRAFVAVLWWLGGCMCYLMYGEKSGGGKFVVRGLGVTISSC